MMPVWAAPIIEGQPVQNTNGALAQMTPVSQAAPTMQVQTSSADSSDLLNTVTQLQQQVRNLEGRLEMQAHQIDQLTQAQKNMYLQLGNKPTDNSSISAAATDLTTVTVNTANAKLSTDGVSVKPSTTATATNTKVAATGTTAAVATPKTTNNSNSDAQQKALYDRAYQDITQQQYTNASIEMNTYLTQYPNGTYAASAHYWLGEIGLVSGDLNSAQTHFQAVASQFPNTPKVPDAQLKLGYIYYQQGKWASARQTLESLVQQYPNTSAATLATQRLQDMAKQGV